MREESALGAGEMREGQFRTLDAWMLPKRVYGAMVVMDVGGCIHVVYR